MAFTIRLFRRTKKRYTNILFFSRKDTLIKDLIETIEKIVRKYPDLKLVPQNDYT